MGREEIISQLWEELKPYCRPETPEPRYAHEIAGDEVAVSGMGCAKLRIGVENGAARVMLGGIVFPLGVQYSSAAAAAQIIFYAQCANNPLWYFSEYILGELVNGDPEREDSVSTLLDYMVKVRNSTSFFSGMRLTPEGFASLGLEPIQANSMEKQKGQVWQTLLTHLNGFIDWQIWALVAEGIPEWLMRFRNSMKRWVEG
jgi:hypothetical protein